MIYSARGGYDAVKKFAETNVKCLDATPFLPFLSYQPVSKGVEELRCRDEVRVERWTRSCAAGLWIDNQTE